MGGSAARGLLSNFTTIVTNTLIGLQDYSLHLSDLPNFQPSWAGTSGSVSVLSTAGGVVQNASIIGGLGGGGSEDGVAPGASAGPLTSTGNFTPSGSVGSINGSQTQTGFNIVQPSTVCNYIIRVG